ncbi:MAG: GNAT family N-acetyltransferase, partial [Solirubrobacterales bacterium]
RRLLAELLAKAREDGYRLVWLETFSELRAAAHLYRDHGFEVVSEDAAPRWGREAITYQRYELELRPAVGPGPLGLELRRERQQGRLVADAADELDRQR